MSVVLHDLTAGYDRRPAVHHLSGMFADASMTAVVGPNGGGKSTLLKVIAGILRPMEGRVDRNLARRDIAYLPQQFEIDRTFPVSVMEVVLLGLWPRRGAWGRRGRGDRDAALAALAEVDMAAFADRPVASLSTGQWQRVLFARLALQQAKLVLLDEPFAAIDGRTTHDLIHVLENWRAAGRTIICVLHDIQTVRDHCSHTLVLAREMIAWGPTAEVLSDANLARASRLATAWDAHPAACAA